MKFYDIFVRAPVNAIAAKMMCASKGVEADIDVDELKYLIERLKRKRKLLNIAVGIKTKAQRKNLKWKINKGIKSYRGALNSRGVDEWCRNGEAIQKLTRELERRNKITPH